MDKSLATITINGRTIGRGFPAYIIAEIGINHNGKEDLALAMIDKAAQAGADAVKFQIISAERSYSQKSESYQIFKKIELPKAAWRKIFAQAKAKKIDCFATFVNAADLADFADLEMPALKISSSNVTNFPLLKAIAEYPKPVILSTGMSYMREVMEAVSFLQRAGQIQLALLQCTALYPTPFKDVNLPVIATLQAQFPQCPIGFSDHSEGIHCAVASVAMGASMIEKHFTLDKKMEGPDHYFSATPPEMAALVSAIRQVEEALGSSIKEPVPAEVPQRDKMLRSLVALTDIKAGEVLTGDKLGAKRSPQKGLEPKYFESILGKKTRKPLVKDEPITFEAIQE